MLANDLLLRLPPRPHLEPGQYFQHDPGEISRLRIQALDAAVSEGILPPDDRDRVVARIHNGETCSDTRENRLIDELASPVLQSVCRRLAVIGADGREHSQYYFVVHPHESKECVNPPGLSFREEPLGVEREANALQT